jgi:hypothetical protein
VLPLLLLAAGILTITVNSRSHAVIKHGEEAVAIRRACNEKGPEQIWRSQSPDQQNKFFQVCRLDDGRLGLRVIACTAKGWLELTAFVPNGSLGNGTIERVREYLSGKARPWVGNLGEMCQ